MGRMLSHYFSGMNDEQARFGAAPESKTLSDGRNIFDVITKLIWTLQFFSLIKQLHWSRQSPILWILKSSGKIFATPG